MIKKIIPILLLLLSGCASFTSGFKHEKNNSVGFCGESGSGIIGVALAANTHDDCERFYLSHGYKEVDIPPQPQNTKTKTPEIDDDFDF